ncbi:MAG TPA: STAUR_1299 family protein [Myxococcaceae bacterium]|nr:STAUR_1299 family protein [Myxococcaceae bacterium]
MEHSEATLQALLDRAFARVKATDANVAIADMRIEEGSDDRPAVSYEVVLPVSNAAEYLTGSLMPRLIYFLDSGGFKLPRCAGVFVSLFHGDDLFFIRAADAVNELCRITGISPTQMVQRFGSQSGNPRP